jgi:hypothetical protein
MKVALIDSLAVTLAAALVLYIAISFGNFSVSTPSAHSEFQVMQQHSFWGILKQTFFAS